MKKSQVILALGTMTSGLLLLSSCSSSNNILSQDTISNSEFVNEESVILPETKLDPLAKFDLAKSETLTNTAKILAGIKTENNHNFSKLENTSTWQEHYNSLASAWQKLETQQISKVRNWSTTELTAINTSKPTIFILLVALTFSTVIPCFLKPKKWS